MFYCSQKHAYRNDTVDLLYFAFQIFLPIVLIEIRFS